jgi:hypothetical protein
VHRRLAPLAVLAAALLAGCGGGSSSGGGTTTTTLALTTPATNAAYERAFTECSSESLKGLATKYTVTANINAVAVAVGSSWADRIGGGVPTARAGELGCRDGIKSRPNAATSS